MIKGIGIACTLSSSFSLFFLFNYSVSFVHVYVILTDGNSIKSYTYQKHWCNARSKYLYMVAGKNVTQHHHQNQEHMWLTQCDTIMPGSVLVLLLFSFRPSCVCVCFFSPGTPTHFSILDIYFFIYI